MMDMSNSVDMFGFLFVDSSWCVSMVMMATWLSSSLSSSWLGAGLNWFRFSFWALLLRLSWFLILIVVVVGFWMSFKHFMMTSESLLGLEANLGIIFLFFSIKFV